MANGRFTLGKQSGGTLGLVFPDGLSDTEVVLPESGELVTKDYVDNGPGANFVANDARVKTALNASGEAPIYACRAFVNFNGTGTVAIRTSGNVSSITDNGTGNYTVNFITAFTHGDYSTSLSYGQDSGSTGTGSWASRISNQTTSNVLITAARPDGSLNDPSIACVNIVSI